MNRIKRRTDKIDRAKQTKPAPIPTTVVVGIFTPWVVEWVGEEEEVVGEEEVEDDITLTKGSVIRVGGRSCF